MSSITDTRNLIRDKFMKKTRNITTDYENTSEILNIPEYEENPDIVTNNISDEKYTYLNDDPLSREFQFDEENKKTTYLCMYMQHTGLKQPFITYYLMANDGELSFPNITEVLPPNTVTTDDAEVEDNPEHIMPLDATDENQQQEVETNAPIVTENVDENDDYLYMQGSRYIQNNSVDNKSISFECYKGFVEVAGEIYVFFDVSDVEFINKFDENHKSCLIEEIINKKRVNGIPISDGAANVINSENVLKYMRDNKQQPILYPIAVYLCEEINGEYTNAKYLDTNDTTMSLINDKIHHPVVGNGYLFTSKLLDNSDATLVKRFALLNYDAVYVLHEPFIKTEYEYIEDNECVCFLSDGIEYWSVKSIDLFSEI